MKDFIVLEVNESDVENCAEVIIEANNQICENLGYAKNEDTSAAAGRLKDERFTGSHVYKGVSGGETVGTFTVKTIGDEKKSFEICMMAVHPIFQGLGIGQKMLDYALRFISSQGGTGAFCAFPAANKAVGKWLEKNGFFVDGFYTLPNSEICIMQKVVTPTESRGSCGSCGQ